MLKFIFTATAVLFFGCVGMRDYTCRRNGAFNLYAKYGFDAGEAKKDYYLIDSVTVLIRGDTKREICQKIGLPDKTEFGIDGSEFWRYPNKKLELLFYRDQLKHWRKFD